LAKRQRLEVVRLRSALQHRRVLSAKRQRLLLPPLLPRRRLLRRLVSLLLQINRLDLVPPRRLPAEVVLARWRVKVVVEVVLRKPRNKRLLVRLRNKRNSKAVLSGKRLVLAISSSNNHKVLGVSGKRAVLDNLLLVLDNLLLVLDNNKVPVSDNNNKALDSGNYNNKALDSGNNKVLDLDNNKIPDSDRLLVSGKLLLSDKLLVLAVSNKNLPDKLPRLRLLKCDDRNIRNIRYKLIILKNRFRILENNSRYYIV
jgi:hypothetical protein